LALIIILSFALGIVSGAFFKVTLPKKINVVNIIVIALLFFMGLNLGSNKDLLKVLPSVGITGLLIAFFSAGCSIIFAWLFEYFSKRGGKK